MKHESAGTLLAHPQKPGTGAKASSGDPHILDELVKVLAPYPGGLRRWSVMRAIRSERDRRSRPVPLRFEAEIERAFRSSCANWGDPKLHDHGNALFYLAEGKAGEVWAVYADQARAWLAGPDTTTAGA
jgi:hypothetical protein